MGRKVAWPYLLMQGTADKVVNPEGAEGMHVDDAVIVVSRNALSDGGGGGGGGGAEFHSKTSSSDKTFKTYSDYFHEIFNESPEDAEHVLRDVVEWLGRHVG